MFITNPFTVDDCVSIQSKLYDHHKRVEIRFRFANFMAFLFDFFGLF